MDEYPLTKYGIDLPDGSWQGSLPRVTRKDDRIRPWMKERIHDARFIVFYEDEEILEKKMGTHQFEKVTSDTLTQLVEMFTKKIKKYGNGLLDNKLDPIYRDPRGAQKELIELQINIEDIFETYESVNKSQGFDKLAQLRSDYDFACSMLLGLDAIRYGMTPPTQKRIGFFTTHIKRCITDDKYMAKFKKADEEIALPPVDPNDPAYV